ncbi:MAG: GHKL domain-containing protein [Holosporaceae bacterium]|nr:GHKL domain-containing protein [Holosporaceae bacterium]
MLSAISCFCTYVLFSNVDIYNRSHNLVILILYCDVAFILILLLLGSHKFVELWVNRHKKGSKLSFRFIVLFSLLSVIPSVFMGIFSAFFFHQGIDSWFNERNRTVLKESLAAAELYLEEHKKNALNDCFAIAKTVDYHMEYMHDLMTVDYNKFYRDMEFVLDDLCGLKGISSAILLDSSLNVIAHSKYSVSLHFVSISYEDLRVANEKGAMILNDSNDKNIIVLSCFKTGGGEYMYLIIKKDINSNIISNAKNARNAYDEYYRLLEDRGSLEIVFILMFLIVGILLLVASIVMAVLYSWKIVKPISNLIDVSANIIDGDTTARANEESSYEEISLLLKTFNEMVTQIHEQKENLININKQLDERIKFTSSVLTGVSSGVIGIDNNSIYIWNSAAEKLLDKKISFGEHIGNLIPEIEDFLSEAAVMLSVECQIQYKKGNEYLLFSTKIESIGDPQDYHSMFVITFDDLTNIVRIQRRIAWEEVARRVAHEIKNPLTPIQLSAERLKKKYISQICVDQQIFSELVDTIIRQVSDIKRLIDDFNFFARLPEPILKRCNLYEVCKQVVFLMETAAGDISIIFTPTAQQQHFAKVDERLLHQSVVNLIQNSINVLNASKKKGKKIWVVLEETADSVIISIEDNGPGLPKEKMESLATPYFTLMPNGTGLGLTIVKKIVQDHGGELSFCNSRHGGARVAISVPRG